MHRHTCLESRQLAFISADGKSREPLGTGREEIFIHSFIHSVSHSFIEGQAQQSSELSSTRAGLSQGRAELSQDRAELSQDRVRLTQGRVKLNQDRAELSQGC